MSATTDHGIILRVRPYRDTSVMVHWLTAESGRIATSVRGARGPRSPFQGKIDLCVEADLSYRRRPGSEIHALGEVMVTDFHPALRRDVASLAILAHAIECLEQVTESDTPQPEVFGLFLELVRYLERQGPRPRAVYAWELRFLSLQGLELDPGTDPLNDSSHDLITELQQREWDTLSDLAASGRTIRRVARQIEGYWSRQFGRVPRGRSAALEAAGDALRKPIKTPNPPDFDGTGDTL